MGILDQLPDLSATVNSGARLQADLGTLLGALGGLGADSASSPLAPVTQLLGEVSVRLDVDMQPLTGGLTGAIEGIRNALPANALSYVESLDAAYSAAGDLLANSEIARQVGQGQSLDEVAQAVIADALALFESRIGDLAGNLIDTDRLDSLRTALVTLEQLGDDFAAHQGDLLPFLADQLIGIAPDLLQTPLAHVQAMLDVLAPLAESAVAAALGPARGQVAASYRALLQAIGALDPADPAGYAQITLHLDALAAAAAPLLDALGALYSQMNGLIAAHAWDTLFSTYITLLDALDVGAVPTVDDLVREVEAFVNDLLARLLAVFDADDLRRRVELFTQSIRDAVLGSPLARIRQTIEGFLETIRQSIEDVPTEDVQRVVNEMLGKAQAAVEQLGIGQLQEEIEGLFAGVDDLVNGALNSGLTANVQSALGALAAQLNNLPVATLLNDLNGALGQLQNAIGSLESALEGQLDSLKELLKQAESLSFKPASDPVVAEIDDLRARLAAINPDALSDVEKLALKGALAVLEAIDLQGSVVVGLKSGYDAAEAEVRGILDQIVNQLNVLRDRVGIFDPAPILDPINAAVGEANKLLDKLNARTLLAPLYAVLDNLAQRLSAIRPGRLLEPLQPLFGEIQDLLGRLEPAQWVAPLDELYAQIDRLISVIDITPVMETLDARRRALLDSARTTILDGFDALDLPEPLDGFLAQMRPVVELLTSALFDDPDGQITTIGGSLRAQVSLATLFAPLDDLFLRLVDMAAQTPPADLTAAMNTIRESVGLGLELLDPHAILSQLRAGQGRLEELAPAVLLGPLTNLVAVKALFEGKVAAAPPEREGDILAVSARFDVAVNLTAPVSGSQYAQLTASHAALLTSLRTRINQLQHSEASAHYAALRANIDHLLPDFLRRPEPLTRADILAGLHAMRPSSKAAPIEEMIERFLLRLQPSEEAIAPAVSGFFAALREILDLINPLALRDAAASIYATLRDKVRLLDPAEIAAGIEAVLAPIRQGLQALDPAAIAQRLNAAFDGAVQLVTVRLKGLLDELVGIVDGQLRTLRAALTLILDQLKAALAAALAALGAVLKQIEELIFVELLGRLDAVFDNLHASFDQELDRVRAAFDEMLAAIPLDGGVSVEVSL